MSISNEDKKFLLNHMNSTAYKVGLGDLIFGSGAGGNVGYKSVSAAYTAQEEDVLINQTANADLTLPLASSVAAGKRFELYFSHASGGDVALSGADTIGGAAGPLEAAQYTRVVVTSDGSSNWIL